jgi:hypothetical protein
MDQTGGKASILPLRASDLVFNRKYDGIMSGGYKVSNALLNSTLNVQYGGGGGRQLTKDRKTSEYDIKTAKLMEDLIVPSGLYYCHPITKHKVFNHKVSKKVKASDSDDEYEGDDNIIDESLYDKLLEQVSPDSRRKYDKKTRKVRNTPSKSKVGKKDETASAGDNAKIDRKNKKTKKVRFAE